MGNSPSLGAAQQHAIPPCLVIGFFLILPADKISWSPQGSQIATEYQQCGDNVVIVHTFPRVVDMVMARVPDEFSTYRGYWHLSTHFHVL